MKHTPGPWQSYNSINGRILTRHHIHSPGKGTVASAHQRDSSEEEAANAQLIAAAPMLAEALRSAEESLNNLAVIAKASGYPGDYQQAIATATQARHALAEAGVLS